MASVSVDGEVTNTGVGPIEIHPTYPTWGRKRPIPRRDRTEVLANGMRRSLRRHEAAVLGMAALGRATGRLATFAVPGVLLAAFPAVRLLQPLAQDLGMDPTRVFVACCAAVAFTLTSASINLRFGRLLDGFDPRGRSLAVAWWLLVATLGFPFCTPLALLSLHVLTQTQVQTVFSPGYQRMARGATLLARPRFSLTPWILVSGLCGAAALGLVVALAQRGPVSSPALAMVLLTLLAEGAALLLVAAAATFLHRRAPRVDPGRPVQLGPRSSRTR